MTVLLVSIGLIGVAFVLLGVNIFFRKKGKFPNYHIGGNKAMAKHGIYCATTNDKLERSSNGRFDIKKIKTEVEDSMGC